MTLKYYLYAGWGLLLIALLFIGFTCGRGSVVCPPAPAVRPCPELVAVACTVTVRDTIRRYISNERIIYRTVPAPASAVGEMEQCLSVEDTSNGAYARMTFCSRELPRERPVDLRGTLELVLPPTVEHTLRYVQTDTARAPRKWFALTAGPYVGYGIGGASAGFGIQLGLKIKEW